MASIPDIIRRDTENILGVDRTEGGYILYKPQSIHNCFPHPGAAEPGSVFQCEVCKKAYLRRNQRVVRKNKNDSSEAFWNIEGKRRDYWKELSARKTKRLIMNAIVNHQKEIDDLKELGSVDSINMEDIFFKRETALALMPAQSKQEAEKPKPTTPSAKATVAQLLAESKRQDESTQPRQVWLKEQSLRRSNLVYGKDYTDGEVIEDDENS